MQSQAKWVKLERDLEQMAVEAFAALTNIDGLDPTLADETIARFYAARQKRELREREALEDEVRDTGRL